MFEEFVFAPLVPEFLVNELQASLDFCCGLCGFKIVDDRPEEGFAYLDHGGAQVMLEERGLGRNWVTAMLEAPLGRGINFQIMLDDLEPVLERLGKVGWSLFQDCEDK